MSIEFSANLSSLRREKNISQKNAAEALGISQALLSHYEKGIRECNLDFVKKAAVFYDVSADYLLGLSDARHGEDDLLNKGDLLSDNQIRVKTIIRSILRLSENRYTPDDASQMFFTDYFTLCIRKYLALTRDDNKELAALCDFAAGLLERSAPVFPETVDEDLVPLCLKTLAGHSSILLNEYTAKAFR